MTDPPAAAGHSARLAARTEVVRRVPAWVWLACLVVASALIRYVIGRRTPAPWIMVDELIFSELAKSFASSGELLIRGQPSDVYGFLYPVLISPAWALFDAIPQAYAAAKAINSLMMSLAAVPAYFLARRVLTPGMSLLAALLTVAVPPMVYTATLMTENAFYPLFIAAALAVVHWLERPTTLRTLVVLGACLVAFLARAQAVALIPAILTAPVLVAGRSAIRRYAVMYGICAVGAIGVVVVQTARGSSLLGVLGAYEVAGEAHYSVREVAKWFVYHVAELDLALGVIPFAALLLLSLRFRQLGERDRIFTAAALSLSFWLVLEVAIFASEQTFRIEERNMFYVAPLFFVALLVWIARGVVRPLPAVVIAAGFAAALPFVVPYEDFIGLNAVSDTPALLPLGWLVERGLALNDVDLVVLGGSVLAGVAFLFVPRRYALALPVIVLAYFAVSQHPIIAEHRFRSAQHLYGGIENPNRDWIDRAVGRGADVSVIWTGLTDKFTVWQNEFFNRSVGAVYTTGAELPGGLPRTALTVDPHTGYLSDPDGKRVHVDYVLTDVSFEPDGSVVAEDERKGMVVYRVDGPLRELTLVTGLYPGDTWSRKRVTYTRHDCRGGTLDVDLQSDAALYAVPNTVVARVDGRTVARTLVFPTVTRTLRIPLTSRRDTCKVDFTVGRTAIPKVVTGGANPDPRPLGVHFNRFEFHAP
jgi:hypothetical protein